ncbi:MAG: cysteine desulfurase family protein [Pseudomonadota bacterium]
MTGLDGRRVYLDWNASAPLRPEAREAMLAAMDEAGNPSSVHAEGRAAKAIVERARAEVAALVGCAPDEVVFTSGATESAAIAWHRGPFMPECFSGSEIEHDAVRAHLGYVDWPLTTEGLIEPHDDAGNPIAWTVVDGDFSAPVATGEIGTVQPVAEIVKQVRTRSAPGVFFTDATQAVGKIEVDLRSLDVDFAAASAHKIGGSKGVGALLVKSGRSLEATFAKGGGQESGRRAGTENVIGIAGFGAAAAAAKRDLEAGVWARVENLRNILDYTLEAAAPDLIIFGKDAPRLPNTTCFAVPGWKGETQVMAMDLAGFAVSAGSACSSGKVNRASRVLLAMGFDETTASSAIRVSIGPTTTEAEVTAFADAWIAAYRRRKAKAA